MSASAIGADGKQIKPGDVVYPVDIDTSDGYGWDVDEVLPDGVSIIDRGSYGHSEGAYADFRDPLELSHRPAARLRAAQQGADVSGEPMARRAGASNGLYRPLVTMLVRGAESIVVRYGDHARAQVVCHGIRKGLKASGVSGVSVDCRGRAVIIRREEP